MKRVSQIASGTLLLMLFQNVSTLLILRVLTVDSYGVYNQCMLLQSIAVALSLSGLPDALLSFSDEDKQRYKILAIKKAARSIAASRYVKFSTLAILIGGISYDFGAPATERLVILGFSAAFAFIQMTILLDRSLFILCSIPGTFYRVVVVIEVIKLACVFTLIASLPTVSVEVVLLALLALAIATRFLLAHLIRPRTAMTNDQIEQESNRVASRLRGLTKPLLPGILFGAIQSQPALYLGFFALPAFALGETAAVQKVLLPFLVMSAICAQVLIPFVQKTPNSEQARLYLKIWGGGILFCASVAASVWMLRDLFFWVIGDRYSHLESELMIAIWFCVFWFMSQLLWCYQVGRRWIWDWMPQVTIPFTVAAQGGYLILNPKIETASDVLLFGVFSVVIAVIMRCGMAFYGFGKGKSVEV